MNRWPAEWEPQSAVMLTWPRRQGAFASRYQEAATCFAQIVAAIAARQSVILSFEDQQSLDETPCATLPGVRSYVAPNDDVWARDHGPIGVHSDTGVALLKFRFDGWGGKYPCANDNALATKLHQQGAYGPRPLAPQALTLEGGAIEGNGAGTLLATRSSVLDPRRNPGLDQTQVETRLAAQLGISRFHWLNHGALAGDDTDGHIDTLARFVAADHIVYQASAGPDDSNHPELDAMREELLALRQADGRPYRLSALPSAGVHRKESGQQLPASYANFLLINGALLLPLYGVAQDAEAIRILAQACPDREILGIDCRVLIRQYGSLHCVTMNLPA